MKKSFIFTFVMAIVGAIIGAGFVSGREIISFFGGYGYLSFLLLIPVAILFFLVFYIFVKLGKELKPKSISDLTFAMFGKAGVVVDFGFILSTFITLSSMLAGSDSIGQIMFGASYNFCYIGIITAMIVTVIVFCGLKYIYKITDAILPIMLVLIFVVALTFLISSPKQVVSQDKFNQNTFSAIFYMILYVFMNTFSNIFIIAKTSQYMNKRQTGIASALSSTLLTVFVGIILLTILHGGDSIFASDMPMLAAANAVSGVFGTVYSIVLWLAIFTTICLAAYTIVQWLNNYIKNRFLCAVITLTLAFIFSRFGFATIVDIFYPIEGIFGGVFIIYSVIFYFKNKKRFLANKIMLINSKNTAESLSYPSLNDKEGITKILKSLKKYRAYKNTITINLAGVFFVKGSKKTNFHNIRSIEIIKDGADIVIRKTYFKKN